MTPELKSFLINAKEPTSLHRLGSNRILIKKIEVQPNDVDPIKLLYPIQISTNFINGSGFSYVIHPIEFFNNYIPSAKFPSTNIPVNQIIEYCRSTTALIYVIKDEDKNLKYKIFYEQLSDIVQILTNETYEGFSFGLSPDSVKIVKDRYKKAIIAKSLSVSRETLSDFQSMHGTFVHYILTALTGLSEAEVKAFDYIIVDSSNGKILFDSRKTR